MNEWVKTIFHRKCLLITWNKLRLSPWLRINTSTAGGINIRWRLSNTNDECLQRRLVQRPSWFWRGKETGHEHDLENRTSMTVDPSYESPFTYPGIHPSINTNAPPVRSSIILAIFSITIRPSTTHPLQQHTTTTTTTTCTLRCIFDEGVGRTSS